MNICVLDFETFFSTDTTLKKMNYSEYVPVATPISVCIIYNNQLICTQPPLIKNTLNSIDWTNTTLVGHNLLFDALVLKHWYGHQAARYIDTLGLARLFHPSIPHDLGSLAERFCPELPKIKEDLLTIKGKTWEQLTEEEQTRLIQYNKNDVLITAKLYELWIGNCPQIELDLIDHTIKTFLNPTLVLDIEKATAAIIEEREEVLSQLNQLQLTKEQIRSDAQFVNYLETMGYTPPTKWSSKQQKHIPALAKNDAAFQEFYIKNLEIQNLLDLKRKINSNIKESRTTRLINAANINHGKIPVAYNYHGAFTSRFSGANRVNLQNLPRGSILRDSIMAPDGYMLVVSDLAQIEARVLAWLAGEKQILDAFRNKRDLYSEVASKIFDRPINKKDNPDERFIGKVAVLGLGYSMSAPKFQAYCALQGRKLEQSFCYSVVETYRKTYFRIPELWKLIQNNLHLLCQKQQKTVGKFIFDNDFIIMPSGHKLRYEGLHYDDGEQGWRLIDGKRIYGALVVENCIAAGTLVLTKPHGWQPIENVQPSDLIHDGIDFVNHGGVVFKSVQACVTIDGVLMTPDHEVLTNDGWTPASQSPRPYRPNLRNINSPISRSLRRTKIILEIPLSMWRRMHSMWHSGSKSTQKSTKPQLWLPTIRPRQKNAQHVQTPNLRSLAQYDRPMPITFSQGLSQLWGTWDNSMQKMGKRFLQFLERYGRNLQTWANHRTNRQQFWLLSDELQMGYIQRTNEKQTNIANNRCSTTITGHRNIQINTILSNTTWSTAKRANQNPRFCKPVYDIINCGPRQRFVVKGNTAPFIVHNCTQGLSRDILATQLLEIHKQYNVVMHTHDEIIACVPENQADQALSDILTIMTTPPTWGPDLPLDAEASMGKRYGDCK